MKALFFSTLAACLAVFTLPAAAQGMAPPAAFLQRDKGNCLACHQVPEGSGPASRADLGPRLLGARMRELGRTRLRELITDPTSANPNTVMPPYGKHRILEPAEIDRVVEYLHVLP